MSILFPVALALLGSIVASFIGVIVERIGTGTSFVRGRSACNSCGTTLASPDLVPIAAWLSTGGRASCCGARLPASYIASEITLALVFYFATLSLGASLPLIVFLAAVSVLAFIVLYDLRHMIVPRGASALLIALAAVFAYLESASLAAFGLTLMTAGVIGLAFFLAHALSRGRVMGLGDSPVALSLSLLVGASLAVPGLVFSFWVGALCGIGILVRRRPGRRMGIEVPFVPFLAAGFLLAYFTGWNPFLI